MLLQCAKADMSCPCPCVCVLLRRPCLQIAVQIALVIAKAARFDFPQQWPTLFNDLLAGVSNSSAAPAGQQLSQQQQVLLVRRTYFVLHHVLKELSSKRLAADQKAFAQVCCGVLVVLWCVLGCDGNSTHFVKYSLLSQSVWDSFCRVACTC